MFALGLLLLFLVLYDPASVTNDMYNTMRLGLLGLTNASRSNSRDHFIYASR
jgi:hypothetical protein